MVAVTPTNGGAPVAQQHIEADDVNLDRLLAGENVGSKICAGLWGTDLVVRRPSGRIQIKKADIKARDDSGRVETLDEKKITKPSFIVDTPHLAEFWGRVDETQRSAEGVLARYSISDARRGFHLVPTTKMGNMLAELRDIRAKRLKLVVEFRDTGWDEYLANLRKQFNGHFYLIEPKLPRRDDLMEKFDITWTLHELAPIDPTKIKFDDVNASDQDVIVRESAGMARHLIQQRAAAIYEEVFGSLLEKCQEIAKGAMETGVRKFGGITELTTMLERAVNFRDFSSNPGIARHAAESLELLRGITDISQVNANEGKNQVSAAIKAAMAPLGTAISSMMKEVAPGSGRSRRRVEI